MTPRNRKILDDIYKKYYGGEKKTPKTISKTTILTETHSRAQLMEQARSQGIKNFRILNKAELSEILLKDTTEAKIQKITKGAVSRWRKGWGTKGSRKEAVETNDQNPEKQTSQKS